ncbi:MAG: diacylglycerol kinase family lipid kinase [Acidobacteriota bacterium]|nr:diacylglycerol kinase family lipid kinase [Blastocatellia bacterium]MDW8411311.1 diacylglycerol kinase family lipid kinase [Acidobacteriota bacterium]
MRILAIVNPTAGGGLTKKIWPSLALKIKNSIGSFECTFTSNPGHGKLIARQEAARCDLILAVGGDGTASEVASGIIESGSHCEFSLLHCGTGGDFRKAIGLAANPIEALKQLAKGTTHTIDAGEMTYTAENGQKQSRYFINIASFGLAGEVATLVNRSSKSLGGTLSFALATLHAAMCYENPEVTFRIDNSDSFRCKITNVSIANGKYFGGGMLISPKSRLDDALFDIVVVRALSKTDLLRNIHRLYLGTHLELPYVGHRRGKLLTAEPASSNAIVRIEVDGEVPGRLPASFRILENALQIRVPKTS